MEMEKIYGLAVTTAIGEQIIGIETLDYCNTPNLTNPPLSQYCYKNIVQSGGTTIFEKLDSETNQYIKLTLNQQTIANNNHITRVLVQVYDVKDGVLKAQMENTIEWDDEV